MKSEIYLIFEIHHAVRDEFEKVYFPSGNKIIKFVMPLVGMTNSIM